MDIEIVINVRAIRDAFGVTFSTAGDIARDVVASLTALGVSTSYVVETDKCRSGRLYDAPVFARTYYREERIERDDNRDLYQHIDEALQSAVEANS